MSLSSALNSALTGLRANTRAVSVVSTNIGNATNEAYGRRELSLSVIGSGIGGVKVNDVVRHSDKILIADRMVSDAKTSYANDMFQYARRLEDMIGESGTAGSLTGRVTAFENALLSATSNPASTQRLEMVAVTAKDLATAVNDLSSEVQLARQTADTNIAAQVDRMNVALSRLDSINDSMARASASGSDTASLEDERQALLNEVSSIVPLRVVQRDKGEIALFTRNGGVLLDGPAYEIGFTSTGAIDASTTLAGGQLSGLTLNGNPIASGENDLFGGGSLAAQFRLRDVDAVTRQNELDAISRDLIERLGPGGPDGTLGAGDAGLFTDNGAAFVATNETGLAGRLKINALIAPGSGGSWRLRDGLGAATTGQVGDATLLSGVADALGVLSPPSSASLPALARSFVDHVSQFSSSVAGERVRNENALSFQTAQNTALKELEFSKGVDTDQELQTLMKIEQYYTANAKVITTVDGLYERLLSI